MALSELEARRRLARGYIGAADRDLKSARALVATNDADLSTTVAYHLQQCMEKIVKGVFVVEGVLVTKEHRLAENLEKLRAGNANNPWLTKLQPFVEYDRWATTARYTPARRGACPSGRRCWSCEMTSKQRSGCSTRPGARC